MGTNYYLRWNPCAACGRGEDELHIGKSSAGWSFGLNTHPENGIESLEDWRAAWANRVIRDEYGSTIDAAEMDRIVTERSPWNGRELSRHTVDGRFCLSRAR